MAWSKCACGVCAVSLPLACGGRTTLHDSPVGATLDTGGMQHVAGHGGTPETSAAAAGWGATSDGGSFPEGGRVGTAGGLVDQAGGTGGRAGGPIAGSFAGGSAAGGEANTGGSFSEAGSGSGMAGQGGSPAIASFEILGPLSPTAVSADGRVIVGSSTSQPTQALRWTAEAGVLALGFLSDERSRYSTAAATNRDGSVVVGASMFDSPVAGYSYSQGYRVVVPGALLNLGALPNTSFNIASGVDATGKLVVGHARNNVEITPHAYRWTESSGLEALADFAPTAVSADARVIVGFTISTAYQHPEGAVKWTADGGLVPLGVASFIGEAHATSADGSVIAGFRFDIEPTYAPVRWSAFRWTEASGVIDLEALPIGPFCQARALSADGSTTVGECGDSWGSGGKKQAAIWDEVNGVRALQDVIAATGVDLGAFSLNVATGVSADGKVFVGTGRDASGTAQGWIARLP